MHRKSFCYAGISAVGFLLTPLCAAAAICTLGFIIRYCESFLWLFVFPALLICAGAGALHGVFRRFIRGRLQMKTTVYTVAGVGVPMCLGLVGIFTGICIPTLGFSFRTMSFFYGLAVFASATFGCMFMCMFDKPE